MDWTGLLYGPNGTVTDARIVKESDITRRNIHVIVDYNVKLLDEWMHNTVLGKRGPW